MKMKDIIWLYPLILIGVLIILTNSCRKKDDNNNNNLTTITDIDGNVYHTVTIGTQLWMGENLKVIHYRNGNPISNITDSIQWFNLATGAYCDYNNDPSNSLIYGKLYNWYAVNDIRYIAPEGWHVPTDAEWKILMDYLGNNGNGGKLKEKGLTHWKDPNAGATNETGFTALPGGYRTCGGSSIYMGFIGYWWSTDAYDITNAYYRAMASSHSNVIRGNIEKTYGFSVRCVKDN